MKSGKPLTKHYLHNIAKLHVLNGTVYTKNLQQGSNVLETVMQSPTYVNNGEKGAQVVNFLNNKDDAGECGFHSKSHRACYQVSFGASAWRKTTGNVIVPDIPCKNGVVCNTLCGVLCLLYLPHTFSWTPRNRPLQRN